MFDVNLVPIEISNSDLLHRIQYELGQKLTHKSGIIHLDIEYKEAYSNERMQYYSTKILADAVKKTEKVNGKVLLLTEFDLYIPIFTYVYGEAQLKGKHSIVSLCRLHEEFYTGRTDEGLLINRALKEILHELGHNFGLYHCKDWDCVMHSSAGIEEVDIKGDHYCDNCKKLIKYK